MMTTIMIIETNNSQKKSVVWTCALMGLSRKLLIQKTEDIYSYE
jgi:hypothetical protein